MGYSLMKRVGRIHPGKHDISDASSLESRTSGRQDLESIRQMIPLSFFPIPARRQAESLEVQNLHEWPGLVSPPPDGIHSKSDFLILLPLSHLLKRG